MKFPTVKNARASFVSGTVYAVAVDDFIFYAQVAANESFGFFNFRSEYLLSIEEVVNFPIMSRFGISHPSVGRALREGYWKKLGKMVLIPELNVSVPTVQWPERETNVSVWLEGEVVKETSAFDPDIQSLEIIMAYDAIYHVPERLKVDYEKNSEEFEYGGSVWRQRKLKEHMANKFPTMPHHQLPSNWIFTS